jgi:hypothetical protein
MPEKVKNRELSRPRRPSIYPVRYSAAHAFVLHVNMVAEGRLYKLNFFPGHAKARRGIHL